jgi:hypothetical protein
MRAKIPGTGPNFPGQEASLWGQLSHVPRCGSHSAGMRKPSEAGEGAEIMTKDKMEAVNGER